MHGQEIRSHLVVQESHNQPVQILEKFRSTCNFSRTVMWNFMGICEMHYHMCWENDTHQDVMVAVAYALEQTKIIWLCLMWSTPVFVRLFEFLNNCWFWFSNQFQIQRTISSSSLKKQNQRTTDPGYFKNLKGPVVFMKELSVLMASHFILFSVLWRTVIIYQTQVFGFIWES
jgi:hypothetical protein